MFAMTSIAFLSMTAGSPVVPGYTVQTYATGIPLPWQMSFTPGGTMYVGRNGPGVAPFHIYEVMPGGATTVEYGEAAIPDPDAVLFDTTGVMAPAGSVIVGSGTTEFEGQLIAVLADESIVQITPPANPTQNPSDMAFDSTGRFLLLNDNDDLDTSTLFASFGGPLVGIATIDERCLNLAVDPDNNIYIATLAGSIIKMNENGIIDRSFTIDGLGSRPPVHFGQGGSLGEQLFTINKDTGELLQVDPTGTPTFLGSGFNGASGMTMDAGGALYIALEGANSIVRVTSCPSDMDTDGFIGVGDLLFILAAWGECPADASCLADLTFDGNVAVDDLLALLGAWGECDGR